MLLLEVPNCGRDCSVTQGYITFAGTAAPQLSLGVIKLAVLLAVTPGRRYLGITMEVLQGAQRAAIRDRRTLSSALRRRRGSTTEDEEAIVDIGAFATDHHSQPINIHD
jgi:hypothetical protein